MLLDNAVDVLRIQQISATELDLGIRGGDFDIVHKVAQLS